ncbi:hypothetical protein A2U01_0046902, partial [Trifolium medium]|nr:hypothetical protein [Trifolium medium]
MTLEEAYDEFMGELEEYYEEEKIQAEECTHCIQRKLPPKLKDPGIFTVPCCIGETKKEALLDLGFSINLMPLSFAKKWKIGKLSTTNTMEIILADQSILRPSATI